ncbi:DUF58 domain-containing protein [Fuerstiella marisgermanici]|uniref:DUF58 domain-containing protein n=1 Tax=Fuerstiella marisgermanici TaxID=1891926 RepID=A0A1P8WQJ3_9PLAN|nr:DUF58 domain-containing protein [Fuerstiella marisgermanici]APZ96326.1 hypothetical protein Fuma_05994 [Fuerstiella marisgermanici]
MPDTPKQLTSLFDNKTLHRIERMRLNPMRRLTNRSRGEHLAGKGGRSTDFADYRDYASGDDLRYVDWNIFARLHRPYIKQFLHEEELHVVIMVDASSSMLFDDKLLKARQLAAAFGIMGLLNVERVSVYAVHQQEGQPWMLPPGAGRTRIRKLLQFLDNIEGGGNVPVERAIETMLRFHRGRGIAILLSDFLTFADLTRSMNMLFSSGLEIWGLQILGDSEMNPNLEGDLRFVDSETGETLDITNAGELLSLYHEHRAWHEETLHQQCRRRNGRFATISSATPLNSVLFDTLSRQGWVLR